MYNINNKVVNCLISVFSWFVIILEFSIFFSAFMKGGIMVWEDIALLMLCYIVHKLLPEACVTYGM